MPKLAIRFFAFKFAKRIFGRHITDKLSFQPNSPPLQNRVGDLEQVAVRGMDATLKSKIQAPLDRHRTMRIATLRPDGWPTTVGYANDGFAIYFLCGKDS